MKRNRALRLLALIPLLTALLAPRAGASGESPSSLDSYHRARAAVERARGALGGAAADAVLAARGLELRGAGVWDPAAELQGRSWDGGDPAPWREALVLDGAGDRLGWESDWRRHDGTREHLRFVYEGDDVLRFVHRADGFAFADRDPAFADDRRRLERLIPHLLLADVAAAGASLRHLGGGSVDGREVERVVATLPGGGETLTLHLDAADGLLRGVEQLVDMPLLGDAVVRWSFDPYRPVPGLGPYPAGYRIELAGRRLKEVRYTRVAVPGDEETVEAGPLDVFTVPPGIETPEPPPPPDPAAVQEAAPPPPAPRVTEVADGVWFVGNVRSGMHAMFVELEDGVVVLEAPSGYLELGRVPAENFAAGDSSGSVAERLLELVAETVPDKPVRHLVLSHFHADHAGGLRPFVARGVTVWAPPGSGPVLERAVHRPHTLPPDRLQRLPAEARIEIVRGRRVLGAGQRQVHLVEVGPNPHVDGMLVTWLPQHRFLFVADLFTPWGRNGAPSQAHLPLMRWFVGWLDSSGLEVERLFATHGAGAAGPEAFARVRETTDGSGG